MRKIYKKKPKQYKEHFRAAVGLIIVTVFYILYSVVIDIHVKQKYGYIIMGLTNF